MTVLTNKLKHKVNMSKFTKYFKKIIIFSMLAYCNVAFGYGHCFNTGERISGLNKICYYDCLRGEVAITIDSYKLCPISIQD